MTWVAVGVAGAGLISGLIGSSAASSASAQQVAAERAALAQQESMFNTIQGNERPFITAGQGAQNQLNYLLGIGTPGAPATAGVSAGTADSSNAGAFGSLNKPFDMNDFKTLTPQYQFNLQQGGQGTLNQDASAQGAESGAALKDLISFNQGFANNSFNSAFQNYQTQQNNVFNRLANIAGQGINAGSAGTTGAPAFANAIGNTQSSIGASQAAGTIGSANALTGGLQSGANAFYSQNALNQILQQGSTVKYGGDTGTFYGGYNGSDPNSAYTGP